MRIKSAHVYTIIGLSILVLVISSGSSTSGASAIFPDEFTQVQDTTSEEEHDINHGQRIL